MANRKGGKRAAEDVEETVDSEVEENDEELTDGDEDGEGETDGIQRRRRQGPKTMLANALNNLLQKTRQRYGEDGKDPNEVEEYPEIQQAASTLAEVGFEERPATIDAIAQIEAEIKAIDFKLPDAPQLLKELQRELSRVQNGR